ncbi:alpha/beta hydrolase [Skermanella rosea]|uniref:alpha/beta fold hydrolase n=1 Tax=Skermanella rosea TaxID=1817965 RepID=UPI001932A34C|nr:alpha/beta hydrolase [Skermanella rosea]UEM02118.1 alpha/beta hydrolase [Skermanella rosea]
MELTVDGHRVFAATGGRDLDRASPLVVLIHGAGMDHSVWSLQARYLAHHGRSVLAVDLPGHGRSGGTALGGIEELADWTARLIEAAGFEQAALAGHSMGGLAALETANRHPGRVRALALLGVAERMPVHPDLLAAAAAEDDRVYDGAIAMVIGWGFGTLRGGSAAPGLWQVGTGIQLMRRAPRGALATDLAACDAWRGAPDVRCPTTLILGAADRMTPAKSGKALAARIAGSNTVVLAGSGHMMMVEEPDAVTDALRASL